LWDYYNDHGFGSGFWEISVTINDQGLDFGEDGEDVTVYWEVYHGQIWTDPVVEEAEE
jgi:hypothetical protein